ncbi:hypothetical protein BAUCODRAFT_438106 [Baudoinia panamericana UAMH 10762]|uniref:Uncharacterized protein n=1 Tax=Baudoinia panamericana (strain UAMH 10762) TaxID=717646 RepID=M2NDW8_BAUPA|nr:uncharacterized protein BAUCODRAFT_438106 [Baudoinia panamericana UAMH 10762]EMC97105.1 hypothetical protein BAUCODRAFT_438106 [Baudoinia panamericana UAMH 10762]
MCLYAAFKHSLPPFLSPKPSPVSQTTGLILSHIPSGRTCQTTAPTGRKTRYGNSAWFGISLTTPTLDITLLPCGRTRSVLPRRGRLIMFMVRKHAVSRIRKAMMLKASQTYGSRQCDQPYRHANFTVGCADIW